MEVNIAAKILIGTVQSMEFAERRQFQEHHKKMVSERMNKTIRDHARCMKLHRGLSLQFLEDVVDTSIYLINRGPSSSLDGGIPEEAWTSKKVNYSFLNPFGCEAFFHINK